MVHKTVAGILPDEWRGFLIKHVCKVVRGGSPRPAGSPLYFDGNFLPWATVADLTNSDDMYLTTTKSMLTEAGSERTRITDPGTLMLTNSGATLGVPKISSIRCGANDGIAMLLDLDGIATEFAYYYLSSKTQYFRDVIAPGVGQPNLNTELIGDFPIPVPPLPEQKKIAQILSTWDKAITTTEQLLANSQQQKKALMQQLLTGKQRLLDQNGERFQGEWRDYHLSHVAEIIVSPVDKKSVEGEVPVELCNYTDVYYNHEITRRLNFMKATAKPAEIKKYTLQPNDVIITKDSETPGDIAVPALVSEDLNGVVCGYHLAIVRPNQAVISGAFLNYLFSMPKTRYYFFTLATGATRFGLSVGGINQAHFRFPPLEEQQKVAAVLSVADQEITALQQQLDHLKQEKKALMQQLLTGKRRVKIN
ncbi:restriction endonuclease subunit S [Marinomonas gallaica]|uniref:restriction endonuclease subunit S n=1 Tax=Marinomonas gallaica TaxID=1806667 RepID=UPI003A8DCC99